MADPIVQDFFKAQVVFQGKSGLPDDVYVNNWCFQNTMVPGTGDGGTMANAVRDRLQEFYTAPVQQTGTAVVDLMPGALLENFVRVKVYDLGQPKPRQPIERDFTVNAFGPGSALPQEVAICASFYAQRNLPRRRGRVFIGPIIQSQVQATPQGVFIVDNAIVTLSHAMRRMSQWEFGNAARWSVLSQKDASGHRITAGWVDNTFDTIRKRGSRGTARRKWDDQGVSNLE